VVPLHGAVSPQQYAYDFCAAIAGGISGSPIVVPDGTAIGVVCLGSETGGQVAREGGPHPRLTGNLPGWLLKNLM
jgi:hypothetical protein